jgi:hypothetical protein
MVCSPEVAGTLYVGWIGSASPRVSFQFTVVSKKEESSRVLPALEAFRGWLVNHNYPTPYVFVSIAFKGFIIAQVLCLQHIGGGLRSIASARE